jgi:hypothetical protein
VRPLSLGFLVLLALVMHNTGIQTAFGIDGWLGGDLDRLHT